VSWRENPVTLVWPGLYGEARKVLRERIRKTSRGQPLGLADALAKGFRRSLCRGGANIVTIPKVFPATESAASLSFNQLHAECQTRIQQKRWCPHCDREVSNSELVKGYEFEKGRYVVVTEEDIQKVRVESTRVIDLVQFADETEIDPIYVDRAYYLAPDGPMAASAFAVMREGMAGKAGIGKVALYGREYLVAIRPQKKGLVMYTLHHDAEIRASIRSRS
jgi:DNA end-binding protein Ku